MTEIAFVLQSVYRMTARRVHSVLRALLDNPGVKFAAGHYPEELMTLWPDRVKDFGDAVLASAAKQLQARVFTFDREFARSLKRLHLLAELG